MEKEKQLAITIGAAVFYGALVAQAWTPVETKPFVGPIHFTRSVGLQVYLNQTQSAALLDSTTAMCEEARGGVLANAMGLAYPMEPADENYAVRVNLSDGSTIYGLMPE